MTRANISSVTPWKRAALATLAVLLSGACSEFNIPNLNQPSEQDLTSNATPAGINAAAVGLTRGARRNGTGFASAFGPLGREGYSLNVAQGGIGITMSGPLSPGATRGAWNGEYRNIRTANILLTSADQVTGMTAAEKEAVRGFTKTMMAYDFLMLILSKDQFGIPVATDVDASGNPAPVVSRAQAYAHIETLLDQAKTHLLAGGSAFSFKLPTGFTGFTTPANFLKFSRALKVRTDVYQNDWAQALAALGESFISTAQPLTYGVYHNFSSSTGDETNGLFSPAFFYADTTYRSRAQLRSDGSRDLRYQNKFRTVPTFTLTNVTSDIQFTIYASSSDPVSWIRNEELFLLRAEANLGAGNVDAALTDINYIRQTAGGLDPIPLVTWQGLTADQRLNELLYNKRYSLVWEWGHSWVDYRHYGKLLDLPRAHPSHRFFDTTPYPTAECEARSPQPAGCTTVNGI